MSKSKRLINRATQALRRRSQSLLKKSLDNNDCFIDASKVHVAPKVGFLPQKAFESFNQSNPGVTSHWFFDASILTELAVWAGFVEEVPIGIGSRLR